MAQTGFSTANTEDDIQRIRESSDSVIVMQPGQQSELMYRTEFETLLGGQKGSGKAQRVDAKVLTPFGFKEIGSLRVGSQVCNPDGSVARVIAIHPQGVKPIFRVKFSDGASTTATEDHLWTYRPVMRQAKGDFRYVPFNERSKTEYRVATTKNLIDLLASNKRRSPKSMPNSIHIPSTKPVNLNEGGRRGWLRTVDPYLLGVLLGDGSLFGRTISFTSIDEEIVSEVAKKISPQKVLTQKGGLTHLIGRPKSIVEELKALGVYGKYSHEKFVPEVYKVAPVHVRMAVIRGLMDTDGTVDKDGSCSFCSSSLQLAQDMQWLIRSIGGVASISSRIPKYTYNGEKKSGLRAYLVSLRTEKDSELFCLSRKKERCRDYRGLPMMRTSRYVTSIEPEGEAEAVCITVDNPNSLYITDDFIVTHNSISSIVWLVRGNLDVPDHKKNQTDIFYINNPLFRGAVIRRNADDLNDWIEKAKLVYGTDGDRLGATYTKQPREFTWPSGAKIICLHCADSESYMRVTGQSIVRLFWDEITFEPDLNVYEKVFSSIRSPHKDLRAQILLACNPEGPGLVWIKERFVTHRDNTGRIYEPGETMRIPVYNPITKETSYNTRVFLNWQLGQNKELLRNDPGYPARLAGGSNPSLVQAYLYGSWDAAGGRFFEFRRKPQEGEPENACHIYDAEKIQIQPWWPRLIGLDWGFSHWACALKIAMSPDGRVWVIDELAHKGVGSKDLGAMLARWCEPDMAGLKRCGVAPVIPVFMSPDAIEQRRDDFGTTAENIRDGINAVYGKGASEIMSSDDTGIDDFQLRKMMQLESKMPLRRASNRRHTGWDRIRELMVWTQVAEPDLRGYDNEHAMRLAERDAHEYFRYQAEFVKKPVAVPKLQISSRCRYLPDALEAATSSPTDLEDIAPPKRGNKDIVQLHDDVRDAFRYAAMATNLYQQITTQIEFRVESELEAHPGMSRERLMAKYKSKEVKGFRIGRGANRGVFVQ